MKHSGFWQGLIIGTVLTGLFLSDFILHLGTPLGAVHNDVYLISFIIKHYVRTFLTGDFKNILTLPMFYGFKNSLLLSEHYFLFGIAAIPLYLIKPDYVWIFNTLAVIAVGTNFLSMYIFVHYLTRRVWPGVLAGVILAFNPFVMAHFPDIIIYYTLGWIPLIFLFIEKSLHKPTNKHTFLVFFFLLMQLATTLTYVVYLSVLLPIYVGVRMWQLKVNVRSLVNRGTVLGAILFIAASVAVAVPYARFYAQIPTGRDTDETAFFSAWPTDYLMSPTSSLLYGSVRTRASAVAPDFIFNRGESAEHNLYWGIVPILLTIASFWLLRTSKYRALWLLSVGLVLYSAVLSYGPKIQFTYTFSIPGPYGLLYSVYPLFSYLRVAARFGVFTYLFIGMISAFVLAVWLPTVSKKIGIGVSIVLVALVLLEYWNKPFDFTPIPAPVKAFYSTVAGQKGIHVILELPMGNIFGGFSSARNQYVDAQYLFWATNVHDKILFNGYSGVIPPMYQERQRYLSSNFPTPAKIAQLRWWGVDGIVMHKDKFIYPDDFDTVRERLHALGLKEVISNGNDVLFDLKAPQ